MSKTIDFDFLLPQNLIATQPSKPRDEAKMLVCRDEEILNKKVSDLADFFEEGDVLVLNDTKVIKAKLIAKRGEAKIEINLHKKIVADFGQIKNEVCAWQAFAKPAKRLKIDDQLIFATNFSAKVLNKNSDGIIDLEFNVDDKNLFLMLEKYGQMPLPPYIKRYKEKLLAKNATENNDEKNYQTVYAKNVGAVAAPTAGLHFTKNLLKKLEDKGIKQAFVTLNVGAGTFLPVKSEYLQDHKMHSEYFEINNQSCDLINEAKKKGKKIIAVGTTSLRVLESAVNENGFLEPQMRETKIFIYPPYNFKVVDVLMTNFHLPKSTLFMLICAFIGRENSHKLYQYAIDNQYRFYSFGDSTLLFKKNNFV